MLENPSINKRKFDIAENRLDKVKNPSTKCEPEDECFATRKRHIFSQTSSCTGKPLRDLGDEEMR
jgi:hypothetical protein